MNYGTITLLAFYMLPLVWLDILKSWVPLQTLPTTWVWADTEPLH